MGPYPVPSSSTRSSSCSSKPAASAMAWCSVGPGPLCVPGSGRFLGRRLSPPLRFHFPLHCRLGFGWAGCCFQSVAATGGTCQPPGSMKQVVGPGVRPRKAGEGVRLGTLACSQIPRPAQEPPHLQDPLPRQPWPRRAYVPPGCPQHQGGCSSGPHATTVSILPPNEIFRGLPSGGLSG